jgi:hypothetical protein
MTVALFEDFIQKEDLLIGVGASGSGSNPRIDGAGGLVEITTGTTSGNWRQLQGDKKIFKPELTPVVTAFLKTNETTNLETFIGLADDEVGAANNLIGFYRSDGGSVGNWNSRLRSGGGSPVNQDLGVPGTTNFIEMTLQASPTEIAFSLNGRLVHVATSTIPTALMFLVVWIKTNTGAARKLVVDYVGIVSAR